LRGASPLLLYPHSLPIDSSYCPHVLLPPPQHDSPTTDRHDSYIESKTVSKVLLPNDRDADAERGGTGALTILRRLRTAAMASQRRRKKCAKPFNSICFEMESDVRTWFVEAVCRAQKISPCASNSLTQSGEGLRASITGTAAEPVGTEATANTAVVTGEVNLQRRAQ
jgi:hypothetical protein